MQAAELVAGLFDHAGHGGIVRHAVGIRHRLAAGGADLPGDLLGRAGIAFIAAGKAAAEIVDHHIGAFARGQQGALLADPVAAAGNQYCLAVQNAHCFARSHFLRCVCR